jgi:DNA-directed RNA polymerase beta subunit
MHDNSIVSFAKLPSGMEHPNLLDVQLRAFETLLQTDAAAREREDVGLERVFNEIFPITDVNGNFSLEFVRYTLGEPKYDMEECMERDMTYAAPLKATLRLVVWEDSGDERRPKDIIEKEVYLGDLPVLTPLGTFIINGAERVIVSQLHRSPGVVFEENVHPNGSKLFSARIIPFRGSWVEFTVDIHDVIAVHIDKKKKFPATALLRAVGYSRNADILDLFFDRETTALDALEQQGAREGRRSEAFLGFLAEDVVDPGVLGPEGPRLYREVVVPGTGEIIERGTRLTAEIHETLRAAGVTHFPLPATSFVGRAGDELSPDLVGRLQRAGLTEVSVFRPGGHGGTTLRATLAKDPTRGTLDSLFAIHNLVRPGTAPSPDAWTEEELFDAGDQVMHVTDFLRAWSERDVQPTDLVARDAQRSSEERMIRFAQERGIRYVWENLRDDREKASRGGRVLVYELNRVVQVYTAIWRLLFQPRASLVVSGGLTPDGTASARSDYSEYTEESLNKRYDLGRVGRYKINQRLGEAFQEMGFATPPAGMTALTAQDVLAILLTLVELHEGRGYTDDIDHLGNRRVRSVGELIANQFSVGLSRMARLVRERMSIVSDADKINIDDLVNARTVSAVIQQFFGSSQLSQFMDQTNPLAEMTHKRRLSALGPGGLTRERAGFEVRDVHYSHYGRMCPIETPEGPNIGLINSLTTYSRINDLGFIETPYRKVVRAVLRYPARATLSESTRVVIGERAKVFAKKGEELDAERGREVFRQMITGAELAEDVPDWNILFPRMLAGEIAQDSWEEAAAALPVLARRGERITDELAERIASQPVNLVRVLSRRAGAVARGVAPEAIRNPFSLPVRVFQPTSAAVLAVPGTVLTEEVVERLHTAQMEGMQAADFSDMPERVTLDYNTGVAALPSESEVGRYAFATPAEVTAVVPVVTRIVAWLSANEEENARIAQANAPLAESGTFVNEFVLCRERGDFPLLRPDEIDYMDVAPDQLVSVAAALIPFLEHDDANRALMGSNMQRQAVPLLFPAAPLVGTGLEAKVAADSGAVVVARRAGVVKEVTADHVLVDTGSAGPGTGDEPLRRLAQFDRYRMKKYWRTNQDTAINQRPLVRKGQRVEKGEVLADGASTENGELALGRNLLVAFMPWYGHNFEDAIVLSEKLVKDDVYTSIHIQELELQVRDTKRGMEEITREIPNVAEESLVDLDERGIVRIGARVKAGDILVGKITPKGETELSPEEKLLTAIFGEKAKDVKDSSLKVPPGVEGTVIDVKIFSRRIDDPILEKERGQKIGDLRAGERSEIQRISEARDEEIKEMIRGRQVALFLKRGTVEPYFDEGTELTDEVVDNLDLGEVDLTTLKVTDRPTNELLRRLIDESKRRIERVRQKTEDQIDKVFQPDELPPGVVQLVKVYLAEKRKISVGDKMAGRHGNKGIIARIVPEEDMPFLPDGRPVDVCLNPLGVPSRMNVGQILETHLGWAARVLGFEAKTPVFQGASEDEIGTLLRMAGVTWAREALGVTAATPPAFDIDDVRALGAAARAAEVATDGAARPEMGIGRSIDRLIGAPGTPAEVSDKLRDLSRYLVAAAREVAGRGERAFEEEFPAAAVLERSDTGEGLNAALEEHMLHAGLTPGGKVRLRDGRSGQEFRSPVTVGAIYMLKLSHLVDDKIHARSIGPYSLVTQQPLAGKAQFGGQRFGEMEVWALEAYGAAHTLQEILTVKSDDVNGRSRVYEAIVKGENLPEPGLPESFNVLVKELQALGISVTLGS